MSLREQPYRACKQKASSRKLRVSTSTGGSSGTGVSLPCLVGTSNDSESNCYSSISSSLVSAALFDCSEGVSPVSAKFD